MNNIIPWLKAARPRTLPLSVAGVLTGAALANFYGKSDILIFMFSIFTTIGFQVTSNFANDYGDGVKGTDNDDRIGPKRALQSGSLTRKQLKQGIILAICVDIVLVISLVYFAFGVTNLFYPLLFIALGALSIWAAVKYTIGESAYGYRGLGDIFVFLFFGLLAVLGSMFLYTKFLTLASVLPAVAIGLLSTGVLNLNNLRDHDSDKKSKKNTLIVKMGFVNGKVYHIFLLVGAFICSMAFTMQNLYSWGKIIPLFAFVPVFVHLLKIHKTKEPEQIDPELKKLALSTFLFAVLLYISCNIFS